MIDLSALRSALYLPASNARAIAKARTLAADLVILDLEDAVPDEAKHDALHAAIAAAEEGGFPGLVSIRINASGTPWHRHEVAAIAASGAVDLVVVPKVESANGIAALAAKLERPLLAMIETPAGVFNAAAIAAGQGVAGLIAGTNDLAATLRLPPGAPRASLSMALQAIVLAARASGGIALDGVWNRLDDPEGFEAECREGRLLGFDGKALIHPSQVEPCIRCFSPDAAEVEEAEALIAAATGGAERFRGRMVETLHVEAAKRLLARAIR
ncbi:CoA ester lyase [Sphingomonas sp.]|uniref:HpcH/HpaI aldolase/citrate lyase family protein n=1 Tax=Sphingomonas sp. TaxID=28214 RepID=UPI000DB787DE|nr:CoA ester lyase [Sphingomonas sp.]PZU09199.1 MAG: CoA ester lyase [Sphingomonas sp.]